MVCRFFATKEVKHIKNINTMKKSLFSLVVLFASILLFTSCSDEKEQPFSIIGEWGMVSGTISDADGTTDRYEKLPSGAYYQLMEFRTDGTLIRTYMPDYIRSYGVFTFNNVTNMLSYKYDGDRFYVRANVQIIDADEMIVTTDYGTSIGRITQYFVKID